ncbi:MAG: hypothetical protein ABJA62_00455 [Luteimonas sp.]
MSTSSTITDPRLQLEPPTAGLQIWIWILILGFALPVAITITALVFARYGGATDFYITAHRLLSH